MKRHHHSVALLTTGLCLLYGGCAELPDARAAWVCNALVEDNEVMLGRDAARVEAKLQTMTEDPYLWLRGSAGLFYREVVQPANGWVFAGVDEPSASDVRLLGDAHIENIGTYLDEAGNLRAEFNDFDAAGFGSFWLETWRLATSFAILDRAGLEDGRLSVGRTWARWVAEGYVETVLNPDRAAATAPIVDNGTGGAVLAELFAKAREKGGERDELADETIVSGGVRKFRFAAYPERQPVSADLLIAPSDPERALAERVFGSLGEGGHPATGALLGVARRQGAGVASMPNLRLYLLLDGASSRREDDLILEVKEVLDPPVWLDPRRGDSWAASDQGRRVVEAQLALQGLPRADRWLGSYRDGQMHFRVRQYTDFQAGLDHEDVQALRNSPDALGQDGERLARTAGRLLARSHAQAALRGGGDARPVLQRVLANDREAFVTQVEEVAATMAQRTYEDMLRFREEGALESCVAPWRMP